ncbi:TCP-1/cpn60 chaperonin family protein [Artemisia annua]|uniref:TCP-1/cpn60 chaperonin family protein n=1 Tax=Artemisia annua TaxID=35608 RepID=A0A2U1QBX1_ARTAN|nr:TCP-1/cpn60 chaperonin family protein [Artemisia annua]
MAKGFVVVEVVTLPVTVVAQVVLLEEAKRFIEDGVHPQNLIRTYKTAVDMVIDKVKELAVSIEEKSLDEKRNLLAKCAAKTLSSKLIGGEKIFFAKMVVDVVIEHDCDKEDGWIVTPISLLQNPNQVRPARFWVYTKLRIFNMTDYKKGKCHCLYRVKSLINL